jgi:hypothetical protein
MTSEFFCQKNFIVKMSEFADSDTLLRGFLLLTIS